MKYFIKILQYIWLLAGIAALVFGVLSWKNKGFQAEVIYFGAMVIVSVVMFIVNKNRYKNHPDNN